ncbi:hypothetical protein [Gordonia sp. NPDC058843]|uniref:hypothetical protein n=1 Tax=Gordonia sp. NPDC058843 TaxID=3346648 RepID=UPI00368BB45F
MSTGAVQLVERYVYELYNDEQIDLVDEICGEPMTRHGAGAVRSLSRREQRERIVADLAAHQPKFTVVTLVGDATFASLTWNAERLTTGERLCGIEIFKVRDGVITDVWNPDYLKGSWS